MRKSYVSNGDLSPTDFFFQLRNAKEDCLLLSRHNGGQIKFNGIVPQEDEELSPTMESDVVLDWLEALGGQKLVEHIFRVYSKDLESESLADMRQTVSENLSNLLAEADQQVEFNRTFVSDKKIYPRNNEWRPPSSTRSSLSTNNRFRPRAASTPFKKSQSNPCKVCLAIKP